MLKLFKSSLISMLFLVTAAGAEEMKTEVVELADVFGIKVTIPVYHNKTFFINQPNSPIQITNVKARHIVEKAANTAQNYAEIFSRDKESKNFKTSLAHSKEGLTVTIDANGSDAVAAKFGILVYDAFNESLGGLTGVMMDTPSEGMVWNYNPSYLFMFEKYGVVGVFVRQARMTDGSIWNMDETLVTEAFLQEFGLATELVFEN